MPTAELPASRFAMAALAAAALGAAPAFNQSGSGAVFTDVTASTKITFSPCLLP